MVGQSASKPSAGWITRATRFFNSPRSSLSGSCREACFDALLDGRAIRPFGRLTNCVGFSPSGSGATRFAFGNILARVERTIQSASRASARAFWRATRACPERSRRVVAGMKPYTCYRPCCVKNAKDRLSESLAAETRRVRRGRRGRCFWQTRTETLSFYFTADGLVERLSFGSLRARRRGIQAH